MTYAGSKPNGQDSVAGLIGEADESRITSKNGQLSSNTATDGEQA